MTKPEFGDLDDELRELLEAEAAGGGGFAAAARRVAAAPPPGAGGDSSSSDEEADEEADAAEAEEGGEDGEGGSRFSKRAMKKWRKCDPRVPMLLCFDLDSDTFPSFCVCRQLESKLQEYYSLDCEDFVAGLPCRFRYKQVLPNKYGLKTEEILALTDKELNQVVSLKKLAPYREEDAKPKCVAACAYCCMLPALLMTRGARRYGGKRERAEAALARLAASERAAAGEKVRVWMTQQQSYARVLTSGLALRFSARRSAATAMRTTRLLPPPLARAPSLRRPRRHGARRRRRRARGPAQAQGGPSCPRTPPSTPNARPRKRQQEAATTSESDLVELPSIESSHGSLLAHIRGAGLTAWMRWPPQRRRSCSAARMASRPAACGCSRRDS